MASRDISRQVEMANRRNAAAVLFVIAIGRLMERSEQAEHDREKRGAAANSGLRPGAKKQTKERPSGAQMFVSQPQGLRTAS